MERWVNSFQTANENGGGVWKKVPENQLVAAGFREVSEPTADLSGILKN